MTTVANTLLMSYFCPGLRSGCAAARDGAGRPGGAQRRLADRHDQAAVDRFVDRFRAEPAWPARVPAAQPPADLRG